MFAGEPGQWIYGRHAALAAIANPRRRIRRIVAVADAAPSISARMAGRPDDIPAVTLTDAAAIAALLPEGAVHQGLAVLVAPLPDVHLEDLVARADPGRATLVVLDQATDPRNVGAVLRAAAAFSAIGVVIQDRHAPATTGALAKAASGALEWLPLIRVVNIARALRTLQGAGFWCAGLAGDAATPIDAARLDGRIAVVLGAEDSGLRRLVRESCDEIVRIPIAAAMESLNVATAAAVTLYEVSRRAGWPGGDAPPPAPGGTERCD
jgi:rRNA methylase, putative, group 3